MHTHLASDGATSLTSSVRIEWIAAVTIAAGTATIGYLAYRRFYVKDHRNKSMVNLHIQKDNPKIVHAYDMEDLGEIKLCTVVVGGPKSFHSVMDLTQNTMKRLETMWDL